MILRSLCTLSILALYFVNSVEANPCFLCASATAQVVKGRLDYKFSDGMTCQQAYLNAFKMTLGTNKCKTHKRKYQRKCCNASVSVKPPTGTPKLPPYQGPVGDEPNCPICRTKEYPGKPNQMIMARYVGEYTCAQLYGRGYHGMIPKTMCGALQDFAYSVCGCGIHNPDCRNDRDKCWGGSKYKAPYIIPWQTSRRLISTTTMTSITTTDETNDYRNLRVEQQRQREEEREARIPNDIHFESYDEEEEIVVVKAELIDGREEDDISEDLLLTPTHSDLGPTVVGEIR